MHDPTQDAHPDLPLLWLFFGSQLSLRLCLCLIFGLFLRSDQRCILGEKRSRSIPWSGPEQCQRESPSPSQAKGAGHVRPSTPCPEKYVNVKMLKCFFSDCHLHLVDSAPVLGVLGLGVARVDDLLVVVQKLLADRTFGVQVL